MTKFRSEGREIFYSSDFKLVATVAPEPNYAAAIGIARRVCALLNLTDGLTIEEVARRLKNE